MAFKDITKILYDGKIKLDYKDGNHAYYVRERINWDLPQEDPEAWSKTKRPSSATTLLKALEKDGLMQWPKQVALRELFGFYNDFDGGNGKIVSAGFSKDVGTLWGANMLKPFTKDDPELVEMLKSADTGWQREQKKGADIGSVVHEAIENFVKGLPYDIAENYVWLIKESEYDSEALRDKALEEMAEEVSQAEIAFLQFQKWWMTVNPILHSAEDVLYSIQNNTCGTYDGDISIPIEHHPKPELFPGKTHVRCTTDWKTTKASKSKKAAAPEGIYYNYFIQDALYEDMRREMGYEPADDLLVVSARKDGGFNAIYLSELGMTVDRAIDWGRRVTQDYRDMTELKAALLNHKKENE